MLLSTSRRSVATGSLQGQQGEGVVFGLGGLSHQVLFATDHRFGQDDVRRQQSFGGPLHRGTSGAAHVANALRQRVKLLVKRRAHTHHGSPGLPVPEAVAD